MEFKLRSGMTTLTWTSMNIDSYKVHEQQGLQRLQQLVTNIYDIIEHRMENNLKIRSRTLLVKLPMDVSFTVMDFVATQKSHIDEKVRGHAEITHRREGRHHGIFGSRSRSSFSRTFGSSRIDCRAASPIRRLRHPKTSRLRQIPQLLACLSLRRRTY